MKLLHTSDWHLGISTELGDRLAEADASLSTMVADAVAQGVDAVIFAGDVFDTRRPGPREIAVFAHALTELSHFGIPVIVTPGNHDGPVAINEPGGKTTAWLRELELPGVHAYTVAEVDVLTLRSGELALAVLPYPHKRSFDAVSDRLEAGERTLAVAQATERVIADLRQKLETGAPGLPKLFVGHLSVAGATLGQGQLMQMGWDVAVRAESLAGFDYAALGHIHRMQTVAENVAYSGAPMRLTWGDARYSAVGWWIVELHPGGTAVGSFHVNPAARELVEVDVAGTSIVVESSNTNVAQWFEAIPPHAYVKVTVRDRIPASGLRWLERTVLDAGATWARATIELPPEEARQRRVVDPAATVEEHLRAYFAAINVNPEDAERALALAHDLD